MLPNPALWIRLKVSDKLYTGMEMEKLGTQVQRVQKS